jgi:uncharacterized protein with HEPN domain
MLPQKAFAWTENSSFFPPRCPIATSLFSYTAGLDVVEFSQNTLIQDAVVKNFEVIGEAAYHVSSELKARYVNIEWSKIQGLRHVLVHDYYKVNPDILWNTKEQHLLRLLADLKELVEKEEE